MLSRHHSVTNLAVIDGVGRVHYNRRALSQKRRDSLLFSHHYVGVSDMPFVKGVLQQSADIGIHG